ncbi:MAG: NADPH:quinone oxidoreductase family protein [Sinobacteraceae bacterium]|nr:NADPH:quinone oxidoreductase family protein [Nevskiaceae bacterium]
MKALLSEQPGGPDTLVLRELPEPMPKAGELRIAVKACSLNYPDALMIEDKYQFRPPRPFAPGLEVAGVVEAVGEDVTAFNIGDRVFVHTSHGGLAERLIATPSQCMAIPAAMPFETAAALLLTYGTSLHALQDRAQLKRGETLLVLGAAGGVGLAAVELGKACGARVVAAVSSAAKAAVAREHGADETLVYPTEVTDTRALAALFKEACGAKGADVIYDPVGGEYAEPALRAIAWEGRYLVIGFPAGIPKFPLNLLLLKGCDVRGVFWGAWVAREPKRHHANMQRLLELYASGGIRPRISARFPLAEGGAALATLLRREALGKIIVSLE